MKQEIEFRDPVVKRVVNKFVERSDVGFEKYGRTLDSERSGGHKDLFGYLNDVQEELMDAILYLQAAKEEYTEQYMDATFNAQRDIIDEELDRMNRMNIIGQNGNDGNHYKPRPCGCHDKEIENE
tara:strand:+ start:124 stop:498 length:375 start_codon:yes stop_codon:yes gene_type:complete